MTWRKFARDRHKPEGEWVQATHLIKVAGVRHRFKDAMAFALAAARAELNKRPYGLLLELDPSNPHDSHAIKVNGWVQSRRWFFQHRQSWHVGFVPATIAEEVQHALVSKGCPIDAELYSIFHQDRDEDEAYLEFQFFVLKPPMKRGGI